MSPNLLAGIAKPSGGVKGGNGAFYLATPPLSRDMGASHSGGASR